MQLTAEQIQQFRDFGYLRLQTLVSAEEVAWVRGVYDRLFNARVGREVGDQYDLAGPDEEGRRERLPQLMNPAKYAPELDNAQFRRDGLAIARQLLGDAAERDDEHAILKPAGQGAATPWHQDEAYWNPDFDYNALSIWVPLQPATLENGCMHFIPGSHRGTVLPHQSIGGDARVHGLELVGPLDAADGVACPLPAGGCTIHHCRTLHYAGENTTDSPRRAYIMMFRLPPVPRSQPRRFPWLEVRQAARQQRAAAAAASA